MAKFYLPPTRKGFTGELGGFQFQDGVAEVPDGDAPKAEAILTRYYGAEKEPIDEAEWHKKHDEDSEEYEEFPEGETGIPALDADTNEPVSGSEDVADGDDEPAPIPVEKTDNSLASPEDFASMTRTELADRAKLHKIEVVGLSKKQIIEKLEEFGTHGRLGF